MRNPLIKFALAISALTLLLMFTAATPPDRYPLHVTSEYAVVNSSSFWPSNKTAASNYWSTTFASSNALYLLSVGVNTESNRITSVADHSIAISNFTFAVSNLVYVQSAGQVVLSNGVTVLSNGVTTLSNSLAGLYQPLDAQLTEVAGLTMGGNAGKVVGVNAGATALELITVSGGSGGGIVLQAAMTVDTTNRSTTSTTYTNSYVEVTLPNALKDTGSRVRIRFSGYCSASTASGPRWKIYSWDGVTETDLTPSGSTEMGGVLVSGNSTYMPFTVNFLHTPGTTTPLTYRLYWRSDVGSTTIYMGRRGSDTFFDSPTIGEAEELD